MLINDLQTLEQLGKIVIRLTSNPALRDDLMQEALVHLWQVQEQHPGQTKNWYLQNCRFHMLHFLALGRSSADIVPIVRVFVVLTGVDL